MEVAAFLLSSGFIRRAASHWAIALSALAADDVDRGGPIAHEARNSDAASAPDLPARTPSSNRYDKTP